MTTTSTAFLTDQYELTMLDAAIRSGQAFKQATFEVFARKLPRGRRYGVVAGTQRVMDAIKDFTFTPEQIQFLSQNTALSKEALNYLEDYKFTGKIEGYAEGEIYFPNSPILTVMGTFADAVILETVILSILNYDSAIASAASRMVNVAKGNPVVDLGGRRTHEASAVAAARASYIAGFAGTSNLEAGLRYGLPTFGTSAHAFVLAHESEEEAFKAQVEALGSNTTLLVDTYNITEGIKTAVRVAGPELGAIRIDSGDLWLETEKARVLLDALGATETKITISSDLDEYSMKELMDFDAPVDSFGVGTRLVTGSGHPTSSMVYKLVEIEDNDGKMRPVAKKANGKRSVGGRKLAWRDMDEDGIVKNETIVALDYEDGVQVYELLKKKELVGKARLLQVCWAENGEQVFKVSLNESREHHRKALDDLPLQALSIEPGEPAIPVYDKGGDE